MSEIAEIGKLERVKTDVEKAREYRQLLQAMLESVCKTITEARKEGIIINFQISGDAFGNQYVASLSTVKELKD